MSVTTVIIFMGSTAYVSCRDLAQCVNCERMTYRQAVFLRGVLWVLGKTLPVDSSHRQSVDFLLTHPRRCFPYLFPAKQTWYLLSVIALLTYA
jgi:Trk-type K+ transport system membrane component